METLKVSSKSVTNSVAGAIAGVIREEINGEERTAMSFLVEKAIK